MGFKINYYLSGGYVGHVIYEHDTDDPRQAVESAVRKGIRLEGADLCGIVLDGAILDGGNFLNARLDGARFDAAGLNGACFDYARLNGASFVGAELNNATFAGAVLDGACFNESSLVMVRFDDASLKGARFDRAMLREASFNNGIIGAYSFDGAIMDGATLNGEPLHVPPIRLPGLEFPVLITPTKMKIGWLWNSHKNWKNLNGAAVARAADDEAMLPFWRQWRRHLLAMCSAHADAERKAVDGRTNAKARAESPPVISAPAEMPVDDGTTEIYFIFSEEDDSIYMTKERAIKNILPFVDQDRDREKINAFVDQQLVKGAGIPVRTKTEERDGVTKTYYNVRDFVAWLRCLLPKWNDSFQTYGLLRIEADARTQYRMRVNWIADKKAAGGAEDSQGPVGTL